MSTGNLGERVGVLHLKQLANLLKRETSAHKRWSPPPPPPPPPPPQWVNVTGAAEILRTSEQVVGRIIKAGLLARHSDISDNNCLLRAEVRQLARHVILTPEITQMGGFVTYRAASAWCTKKGHFADHRVEELKLETFSENRCRIRLKNAKQSSKGAGSGW